MFFRSTTQYKDYIGRHITLTEQGQAWYKVFGRV
jgi:hypothetical protein